MSKLHKGKYTPENPEKYVGKTIPIFRSHWELVVCRMCDHHPNITQWASEPMKIPYKNPLTGRQTVYVPDFLVMFEDRTGATRLELWEVKPAEQAYLSEAKRPKDQLAFAVNMAKWGAARKWAKRHNAEFRVITQKELFRT